MEHSDLTEAPKHDAKNIVLFIKNVCIKNEIYQYNSLYYNLINIFQQTLNNYSVTNAKPFTPSRHIGTNEGEEGKGCLLHILIDGLFDGTDYN